LLDRSDLTIDAFLACPTNPVCPTTIPIFNFYFTKCNGQENRRASEEEAPASTAQNSGVPVNHKRKGGSLLTNDAPVSRKGGFLTATEAPVAKKGGSLISLNTSQDSTMRIDRKRIGWRGVGDDVCSAAAQNIWGDENFSDVSVAGDPKAEFYTTKSSFEEKPSDRKEVQASNYGPQDFDAGHEEVVDHQENGTWSLMPIHSHQENGTWSLVPLHSAPMEANILRIYDGKMGFRFKAPLTAMGDFQWEGGDYFDAFAFVSRIMALRVPMPLLDASPNHKFVHWDIMATLINAEVEEDRWIYQPDGHQTGGSEGMICKRFEALYHLLEQEGRAWQMFPRSVLSEADFSQPEGGLVAHTPRSGWCVVGTRVDVLFPLHGVGGRILRDVNIPGSMVDIHELRATYSFYDPVGCLWWLARIAKIFRYLWMLL
jgi:hypothetical protein